MAKKKKSKKHNFSYAKQGSAATARPAESSSIEPTQKASKPTPALATVPSSHDITHLQQIKGDVRGVLVLAASFVILQLVLWFVLEHTAVGTSVYSLIKL